MLCANRALTVHATVSALEQVLIRNERRACWVYCSLWSGRQLLEMTISEFIMLLLT